MSIPPGSYAWYIRKNALVKILEFDLQSNSYTIEYEGRVIDTIERFLDQNIGFHHNKILEENEKRVSKLEAYISELENINKQQKEQYDDLNRKIEKKSQGNKNIEKIVCTTCCGTGIGEYSWDQRQKLKCATCNGTCIISLLSNVSKFDVYNEGHPERSLGDAFSYKGVVLGDGSQSYRK